jgi:DNA-binding transcriptional regulator YdaS (Cro superfamily)
MIPAIIPAILSAVAGSTSCASTRPAVAVKRTQKTFRVCSFLPNADQKTIKTDSDSL